MGFSPATDFHVKQQVMADVIYMSIVKGDWKTEIETWLLHLRAAGRAESTMRTRREHVTWLARDVSEWMPSPWTLTHDELMAWAGSHTWAAETRRGVRASIRGFYTWAVQTGRVEESPAEGWPRVRAKIPQPRPASEDDYLVALERANQPRKRVMLRLAAEAGLRRAEVAVVHRRDLFQDLDGWSLWVHGKGGTLLTVPITTSLAGDLLRLIDAEGGGYAFPGNAGDGHLSPRWVGKIVTKLLPDHVTMHQLRHKFGTDVHGETGDLLTTQGLLRHASVATTQRYVKVSDAKRRAAVQSVKDSRRYSQRVA